MKNLVFIIIIVFVLIFMFLNIHIIKVEDGYEFTSKKHMTFKDTYVDVREWNLLDYFEHSPKIRNHLFNKIYYEPLMKLLKEKKKESIKNVKKTLKEIDKSIELIYEKFNE